MLPARPRRPRSLLAALAALSVLALLPPSPTPCAAHEAAPLSPAVAGGGPAGGSAAPSAGEDAALELDERLGAKIPLDAVFRDEAGRPVPLSALVTVPTVILPVYFGCTNVCNFLQAGMARVLPSLSGRPGADFRIVSVSIDDTEGAAEAARAKRTYLQAAGVPVPDDGWRFLTGDNASIRRLTDAAGYGFERRGRDFVHPVATLVVSPDGTIVRYLYGTDFLPKDLSLALLEARAGRTGRSIRTVVRYCFSFDPVGKSYVFNLLRVSATVILATLGAFLAFLLLGGRGRKGRTGRGATPAAGPPPGGTT